MRYVIDYSQSTYRPYGVYRVTTRFFGALEKWDPVSSHDTFERAEMQVRQLIAENVPVSYPVPR